MLRFTLSLLAFASTLLVTSAAFADEVVSCHDGDTCRISTDRGVIRVRIAGIDAPELNQTFGIESRDHLYSLLQGNDLRLKCTGSHGNREVCFIFIGPRDIGREMVAAGMAWETIKFSKGIYSTAQKEAKNRRLGFWGIPGMQSPFCFKFNTEECALDPMLQP